MNFYRTFAARVIDESGKCPRDEHARTTAYFRPQSSPGSTGTVACPGCGRRWSAVTMDPDESTQNVGVPPVSDFDTTCM